MHVYTIYNTRNDEVRQIAADSPEEAVRKGAQHFRYPRDRDFRLHNGTIMVGCGDWFTSRSQEKP